MQCDPTHESPLLCNAIPLMSSLALNAAQLMKECVNINKSLSSLEQVMLALQEELRKTTVGPLPRSVSIDVIDAGDVAWRLLDIKYDGNSSVAWLALAASNGTRSDPIRLDMNASGLAERGGDQWPGPVARTSSQDQ